MIKLVADIPRTVLMSLGILAGSLVIYILLVSTLGSALDSAISQHDSLNRQISNARGSLSQSEEDQRFILDNQEYFEELMNSDRLIPHTRRAAITELQRAATDNGLSNLTYSFQAVGDASAESVGVQPATGAYKVSLEQLEMRVGAPFDGPIYKFLNDLTESFSWFCSCTDDKLIAPTQSDRCRA